MSHNSRCILLVDFAGSPAQPCAFVCEADMHPTWSHSVEQLTLIVSWLPAQQPAIDTDVISHSPLQADPSSAVSPHF